MDPPYLLQPISAHTDRADGPSRLQQYSWPPVLGSEPYTQPPNTLSHYAEPYFRASESDISSQSFYTAPSGYLRASDFSSQSYYSVLSYLRPSDVSSQSYYSADSSLSYPTTNSASTWSSNISFPYSITSINSRKSRKNVLYPRRAHPLPVAAPSEHFSISHDTLIQQIQFLCVTLLPQTETRLVSAGIVLIQSSGLHGDISQPMPSPIDEETRYCSELFIALAHEVLLKDATGAGELEGPCKLLHAYIISPLSSLSFPKIPKSDETSLQLASGAELQWFSEVLFALLSVFNAFKRTLNAIKIKPEISNNGAVQHHRTTLLDISESTGLTMNQYRKKLDQDLAQIREQLNRLELSEGAHLSAMSLISLYESPQSISTIEEGPEAEGEGGSSNGRTQSHSDSGRRSLPRRVLRHPIPPSVGRRE
ncbi:hypothetical protein EDB83DRAFT_2523589 [Lactarius deliciosus]|nr:hypothetical protein EDB83DRAFT_2523589 [Lactarius deliciosus]